MPRPVVVVDTTITGKTSAAVVGRCDVVVSAADLELAVSYFTTGGATPRSRPPRS